MIQLPNGCACSEPSVYPKNWKSCKTSAIKKKWYIQYYFHDPELKEKYKYGKLVIIKAGINRFKTVTERRTAVKALRNDEINRLHNGYNPITNKTTTPFDFDYEIDPHTASEKAIKKAAEKITGAKSTRSDLNTVSRHLKKSLKQLRLDTIPIKDLKRRHIKATLENLAQTRNYSSARYNKVRSYVMIIFSELVELETIDYNPVREIKKRKVVKKIRTILTENERRKVNSYLKENVYSFWRFCQVFFHSGCRITELMQVKSNDVNILKGEFKVLVKKGRNYEEQLRPINKNVKKLWMELLNQAQTTDYLFSTHLIPGSVAISERQITRRWKRHVKDKLNITADFYALKHLHTDMVDAENDLYMASAVNGHKSTDMALNHYAVGHKNRQMEKIKNLDVKF